MKKIWKYVVSISAVLVLQMVSWAAFAEVDARAVVTLDSAGLSATAPHNLTDYNGMTLNIASPGGGVKTQSVTSNSLYWSAAGASDGLHRYTVHVSVAIDNDYDSLPSMMLRTSGSFYVSGGQVELDVDALLPSHLTKERTSFASIISAIGNFFIPSAHADVTVESITPTIDFDDISPGSGRAWQIEGFDTSNNRATSTFKLEFQGDGVTEVIDIVTDEDGDQSLVIDEAGDITLANGAVFIDRSLDRIGLGTSAPLASFHIKATQPAIQYETTNTSPQKWWNYVHPFTNNFYLEDVTGSKTALIVTAADGTPSDVNYLGLGTTSPLARIHVYGDSPSEQDVQIRVQNLNSADPGIARKLFQIVNDGPAKFSMFSSEEEEWVFNARDEEFRISKQGTGRVEMELSDTGNLSIIGTLAEGSSRTIKQSIVPINESELLSKVIALPIAEWSYIHDGDSVRHLGPMSEDFYAAFGLGHSKKKLASIDTGGVALAAIKALKAQKDEELADKDREIADLREQLIMQQERMLQLEMAVSQIMANSSEIQLGATSKN